jgi:predicted RNase H-like nuclease
MWQKLCHCPFMSAPRDFWLAGVDGCKDGWLVVLIRPDGQEVRICDTPIKKFGDVITMATLIAVDMPIGLPELGGREAEKLVRPLLGRLSRSVFPVPSRKAVFSERGPFSDQAERYAAHQRACVVAAATSKPSRRVTMQTFGIFPKIQDVDESLRSTPRAMDRVFEVHPEVAFWQLNGGEPLTEPKKRKGKLNLPGIAHRRELLRKAHFPEDCLNAKAPKGADIDDLLDALACAAVARKIFKKLAISFPSPPIRDACGIPMAIWA